jgi:hypothetical protein
LWLSNLGCSFFATVYYQSSLGIDDDVTLTLLDNPTMLPRSFQNCLKPVGVPCHLWDPKSWVCQVVKVPQKPNHLGQIRQQQVVDSVGPVPLDPKVQVQLETGLRHLDPEEWMKIKGLPNTWRPRNKALREIVESPGSHEWGALGDFVNLLEASRHNTVLAVSPPLVDAPKPTPLVTEPIATPPSNWS